MALQRDRLDTPPVYSTPFMRTRKNGAERDYPRAAPLVTVYPYSWLPFYRFVPRAFHLYAQPLLFFAHIVGALYVVGCLEPIQYKLVCHIIASSISFVSCMGLPAMFGERPNPTHLPIGRAGPSSKPRVIDKPCVLTHKNAADKVLSDFARGLKKWIHPLIQQVYAPG